ncbi:MAG: MarR family transcriptional regulator [Alphaproteobacteria bacterium]|nr:MarR family transcriptional regulator [Alphaproteobacteria bacterium]
MSDKPRLFYYILRNYTKINDILNVCLDAEDITAGQYTILSVLARIEPATSAELARRQKITSQTMGETLGILESKGLIERELSSENKRNILVRRTKKGAALQARCDAIVRKAEKKYVASMSPDEAEHLTKVLANLYYS